MDKSLLTTIMNSEPEKAWESILDYLWQTFSSPIRKDLADVRTTERDRSIAELDNLLTGAAWELWNYVAGSPLKTSSMLKVFWKKQASGKSVLVLDGLSLREAPWIINEAKQRGFIIQSQCASLSEIPGDTTPFAKALGFGQRSNLGNSLGRSEFFEGAYTESTDLPFADCTQMIKAKPGLFFWHHWPDSVMHDLSEEGNGGQLLSKKAAETLSGDEFWQFIEKFCTGRTLVITGDHGYAQSGLFRDLHDKDQISYMKSKFRSGRAVVADEKDEYNWVPPLLMQLQGYNLVLGRRKWKSPGGYPTLTHGGLSLLEVTVPFIELRK